MENKGRTTLAQDIKDTADSLLDEQGGTWTGAVILRTVPGEETGLDYDIDLLYFRLKDTNGAIYWISEDNLDELTDEDMKQYL